MLKLLKKWIVSKDSKQRDFKQEIDKNDIPRHVAIIMDGNGRWAKKQGLPRVMGHHSGMKNVRSITIAANSMGIKVLTLYAFSTENWKRPKEEVDFLMKLPEEFFPMMIDELIENNIQIKMIGNKEGLPDYTLKSIENAIELTKNNTGMILNFALNYGSRNEMMQGFNQLFKDIQSGELNEQEITEEVFSSYLHTSGLPDPDLLIRTSGELRISNFMLWQLAYSELWFTDAYWPEFNQDHFLKAILEYQNRARRYGGL
ncbi:isoprenyl transferase [Chengkuizengella axinellae]|uniref:Isoprenyl transferase n=1 Tax=Chengkuizengella axinellae TaxID=3064388 RepID=A0ABT9IVT9_9BACL|nr:isoprenyl transferase [Chengkuizengella sp. 2205SS18-9]MDP5273473.1 isoprenyl transferase [Chengkuizengella sp. 2205SS18-9]